MPNFCFCSGIATTQLWAGVELFLVVAFLYKEIIQFCKICLQIRLKHLEMCLFLE